MSKICCWKLPESGLACAALAKNRHQLENYHQIKMSNNSSISSSRLTQHLIIESRSLKLGVSFYHRHKVQLILFLLFR